ncbi:hypothetical protein PoB_006225600 [Plakobranchus ocellatus]|uniref:Integrase catalytic domain-containing protein n=1 Tax=Plakobranchus ocellatus TaxID=259542 RepID=A0AAV4CV64_9GAST|nr:hypothetical protein PoB_006225600 [Plakobranchus ocellatus]
MSLSKDQEYNLISLDYQLVNLQRELKFVNLLEQISSTFHEFYNSLEKNRLGNDIVNHRPTYKCLKLPSLGSNTNNICESENKRLKKLFCATTNLPMAVIEPLHHSTVQQNEVLQEQFNVQ